MSEEHHIPPSYSIKRWLFSTNHKDIGSLYIVTSLYFLFVGGALALLVRVQLTVPNNNFIASSAFNQAFTTHGLIMVLWFLSPFAFGFANWIVPLQIGARDLAFPRINALSYWLYLFSGILLLMSSAAGLPDGGWTLYAPLTTLRFTPNLGLSLAAGGLILFIVSITVSSVNFITTILKMRAPGMKLMQMPMFTWTILLTVFMMLYAFPSLLAGTIMLMGDRTLGTMYFGSPQGGSLLWDHLFWFFGHPEVYVVLFPAMGAIGDIIPTFTRRPLYGRKYIIMSFIIVALLSFGVWGHHMFVTGYDPLVAKIFTVTTIAISLPFDIIVIAMIESLVKGKVRLKTPMLFVLGSIALFIVGGITGVFLGSVALDYALRGTYFVVAHFHYVMVGGGVVALFGAFYYWYPKITGKMYDEGLGKAHFVLSVIGFTLLYFPMFMNYEMPRRVVTFTETQWAFTNYLSTIGGFVFGLAQILMLYNFYESSKTGAPAGSNPWNGFTLEWAVPSPPPQNDFDVTPRFSEDGTISLPGLGAFANGGTHTMSTAHAEHGIMESHLSQWPVALAGAAFTLILGILGVTLLPTASFIEGMLYLWILLTGFILGGLGLYGFAKEKFVSFEDEEAEGWPFKHVARVRMGVWVFLASEVILFGTFIGAYIFIRAGTLDWPAINTVFQIQHGAINTFILLTSSFTAVMALVYSKRESKAGVIGSLLLTIFLGLWFLYNKATEWQELFHEGHTFDSGVVMSTYYITTGAHGAHVIGGLAAMTILIGGALKGRHMGEHGSENIHNFGLYWHIVDIIWIFLFPLFYLI
ncbi:MAG: cbb3-type cytochrome c oxidase subunit I [Thaumarchaeota archaeon]|nr:cbb3-type cytochrome c oxidase subunit I [Nitrososphaerota archaeon]